MATEVESLLQRLNRRIMVAVGLLLIGLVLSALYRSVVRAEVMEWVLATQADWDGYSAVKNNVISTPEDLIELASPTTWQSVASPISYSIQSIDMLTSAKGWAVATDLNKSSYVLRWDGSTWAVQQQFVNSNRRFRDIDMVDDNSGWVAAEDGSKGYIYFWDGSTWTQITNQLPGASSYAISMLGADFGWVAGSGGKAAYCSGLCNQAASWTAVNPFNDTIWDIKISSTSNGWAVGANGSIYQYSGGTMWTKSTPAGNSVTFYGVDEVARNDAWVVGSNGKILYFNGTGWTDKTSEAGNKTYYTLKSVRGIDTDGDGKTNKVWVVASNGQVAQGTCSGSPTPGCTWTWTTVTTGALNDLFIFPSGKAGFAVGDAGKIFQYGGVVSSGTAEYTFNAGNTVNWTAHAYAATIPTGTNVAFEWATSDDGAVWSGWTADLNSLPNSRYLKQRITLASSDWTVTPRLMRSAVTYQTDIDPPAAPTGLAVSTGTSQQAVLSWQANTEPDLAGYYIYRSSDGSSFSRVNSAPVTGTSFVNAGLTNGVRYYFKITAVDTAGNESAASAVVSAVVMDSPPAAPKGLSAVPGDGKVTLSWTENVEPDLRGYNVYSSIDGSNFTKVNSAVISENLYVVTGLNNNTTYHFRITAVDQGNNESDPSGSVSAVPYRPDQIPPAAPAGLQAAPGDSQVALSWDANTEPDLAGYNIYRSTDGVLYTRINGVLLTGTSFVDTDRINGRTYYYQVTAVDRSNNESARSNTVQATPGDETPPSTPTGLRATAGSGEVRLKWNPNTEPDLSGYNIYRSNDGTAYVKVNQTLVTADSYTDTGLVNGMMHFYRVAAVDNAGNESERSNAVLAIPGGRAYTAGPADTKAQVMTPNGVRTVRIQFTPTEGVTYAVYRHGFGNGRTFVNIGGVAGFVYGNVQSADPNWGWDSTLGYMYYLDTGVLDYAEYYYFVRASTDPAWPEDSVTGQVYIPLEDYVVARAFPPGQTMHGEFTEFTGACTGCHGLHSAPVGKLIKGRTITDLCGSCHDGSGSKYDMVMGRVRTGASWASYTSNPAGAFGTQLKNVAGAPVMKSVHNVYREGFTADGSVAATAAQYWQAPGSTYLVKPQPDPGTWTGSFTCAGCHEPHNRYNNFRLLRGDFNVGGYQFPADGAPPRTQIVVRGVSEVNLDFPGGGQSSSRYLAASSSSPTGAAITDFCTGCHRVFAGPYNEKMPTLTAGQDYHDPRYDNVYDYDPTGTNADNDALDIAGTHGFKRHMMAMPATNALLFGGDRIIDPGRTGPTGNQARLVDWNGGNINRYVPLEGQYTDDGESSNGNEYARNKVVCLTCHLAHGSMASAGGAGPNGDALHLEVAYKNNKLNRTEIMPDQFENDSGSGYELGRSPVSGYLHNRNNGVIYGSSSVLSRFEPFASACWRCHSTK